MWDIGLCFLCHLSSPTWLRLATPLYASPAESSLGGVKNDHMKLQRYRYRNVFVTKQYETAYAGQQVVLALMTITLAI